MTDPIAPGPADQRPTHGDATVPAGVDRSPPAGPAPTRAPSAGSASGPGADEDALFDLLRRVCRAAVGSLVDVHWAGVTARFAVAPFTAAHTDDRVLLVDEGQYAQGDGPCLAAMRTDRQVAATLEQARHRWPQLARVAAAAGVRSFLAAPLHAGDRTVGALNLYSARRAGLRNSDPSLLTLLTGYLDRGLSDYRAAGRPGDDEDIRLQSTLRDRWVTITRSG